jgi:SAM-dependent methyltransferase
MLSWILRDRRLIVDSHKRLNTLPGGKVGINTSINKEAAARDIIFSDAALPGLFLDVGSGDADLTYLLGIKGNLEYDGELYTRNKQKFDDKFQYRALDIRTGPNVDFACDICKPSALEEAPGLEGSISVAYSNNVFEHLNKPWIAAQNIARMLKPDGICITIVPFALRYHEAPGDYFRYTHTGVEALFEDTMKFEVIEAGYDILGRRNDWQGSGKANDRVPEDEFGSWRENWFTIVAIKKC